MPQSTSSPLPPVSTSVIAPVTVSIAPSRVTRPSGSRWRAVPGSIFKAPDPTTCSDGREPSSSGLAAELGAVEGGELVRGAWLRQTVSQKVEDVRDICSREPERVHRGGDGDGGDDGVVDLLSLPCPLETVLFFALAPKLHAERRGMAHPFGAGSRSVNQRRCRSTAKRQLVEAAATFKRAIGSLPRLPSMKHPLPTSSDDDTLIPCGDPRTWGGSVTTEPLQTLVLHTAWANQQLFGALRDAQPFEAQQSAHLIVRLLDHIHVVRRIFQAHLQGVPHGLQSTQSATLPSLESLARESATLDRWYVDAAATLGRAELGRSRDVRFTDGNVVQMTAAEMILHVVTHTIHHRGNIDAVMFQSGMPRRRDGIPEFLVSRGSAT